MRPKVLASAFSTEMGRLRDAGSAAAEAELEAAAAAGGEDGMMLDGASDVKAEVRVCFRPRAAVSRRVVLVLVVVLRGGEGCVFVWVMALLAVVVSWCWRLCFHVTGGVGGNGVQKLAAMVRGGGGGGCVFMWGLVFVLVVWGGTGCVLSVGGWCRCWCLALVGVLWWRRRYIHVGSRVG